MGIAHVLKTVNYSDNVVVVDDDLLKHIQADLLNMLKDIAAVCEKYSIKWCLSGGSVLGAVRHKGFIPWDDDIDIFMERSDYDRFRKAFKETLSDKYVLRVPGDKGYVLNLPQIQKKGTFIRPIQSKEDSKDGLFIDIFILENTFDNSLLRNTHGLLCTLLLFIDSAMRMEACKSSILKCTGYDERVKREVQKRALFAPLFRFLTLEKWLKITDDCFSFLKNRGAFLVCPSGAKHFFGELYPSDLFERPMLINFETETFYAPNPPEEYLRTRFGNDYMKLPEEKDRERHVYSEIYLGDVE